MTDRIKKLAKPTAIILAIGFAYLLIHELTGLSLFCPIYKVFGLYCPGCGTSRIFFHMARFEFLEAFKSNCVVFCMLPIALIMALYHAYRYLRCGSAPLSKAEHILLYTAIGILIVFGIVRNIWRVDFLVPS